MFENGEFRSTQSHKFQFGEAAYTARKNGDAIAFEAEALSPAEGRMKWRGSVQGTHTEATVDWYDKEGNLVKTYWVKASLKKE